MLKGAIHIHSTYSDGELSLGELRDTFLAAGCTFACVTDHAEQFDADKLNTYVRDCTALSDSSFCLIPGLEFECRDRMHVLGYGVTSRVATDDPQEVIRHIQKQGGVSVIAHPREAAFSWIESFQVLPDGIEAWNSKYDGRYAPRPSTIALLHRLQLRKPELRAFYGQDLHWKRQYRGLLTVVGCQSPVSGEILGGLARGDYRAVKGGLELPSTGHMPESLLKRFAVVHRRSDRMRALLQGVKNLVGHLGISAPKLLKAQLRRIF